MSLQLQFSFNSVFKQKFSDHCFLSAYDFAWNGFGFEDVFVHDAIVYHAKKDGVTIGIIIVDCCDNKEIRMIYVLPEYRRMNVATLLFDYVVQQQGPDWNPFGVAVSKEGRSFCIKNKISHHEKLA